MSKDSEEEFLLTGVFETSITQFKLTKKHRELITDEIEVRKHHEIGQFLSRLEDVLNRKNRADELRTNIKLANVRDRVEDIRKLALNLLQELDRSDGHTWELLAAQGDGPARLLPAILDKDGGIIGGEAALKRRGMNAAECMHGVFTLYYFASEALGKLPKKYSGKKQKSLANVQLGVGIAKAMEEFLDIKPVSGGKQLLSRLLVILLYIAGDMPRAGTEAFTRDVRGLVKQVLAQYEMEL